MLQISVATLPWFLPRIGLAGVILGVKAVGTFQIVMRVLKAKLDQMPARGVGAGARSAGAPR